MNYLVNLETDTLQNELYKIQQFLNEQDIKLIKRQSAHDLVDHHKARIYCPSQTFSCI